MVRFNIKQILIAIVGIALTGCDGVGAVDPSAKPSADSTTGFVLVGVRPVETAGFSTFWNLGWRRVDPPGEPRRRDEIPLDEYLLLGKSVSVETDPSDGTLYFLREVTPGPYRFDFVMYNRTWDTWTVTPDGTNQLTFEVKRGETVYIGTLTLSVGSNDFLIPGKLEDRRGNALGFLAARFAIDLPTRTDIARFDPSQTYTAVNRYYLNE